MRGQRTGICRGRPPCRSEFEVAGQGPDVGGVACNRGSGTTYSWSAAKACSDRPEIGAQGPEAAEVCAPFSPSPRPATRKRVPGVPRPFSLSSHPRRGVSLLEVLASIGVLSIGLLGLAALLPIGRYTISEAVKGDRAGDCGRAALRDIVVRRMLDSTTWTVPTIANQSQSFLLDPIGCMASAPGMNPKFGGTAVPRITLNTLNTVVLANQICMGADDLKFGMPEDMTPPQPVGRPTMMLDASYKPVPNGDFSWFATVTPMLNNPTRFTVSIVVCSKRVLNATSERAVTVSQFYDQVTSGGSSVAPGGGSILLSRPITDIPGDTPSGIALKENDWVALCNKNGLCRWYRVASIGNYDPTITNQYMTLVGPDWPNPAAGSDQLVALAQNVVGVYTTTVELDSDPTWKN